MLSLRNVVFLSFFTMSPGSPLAPCQATNKDECQIQWSKVLHNTFDPFFRSPSGPITPGNPVRIRIRTSAGNVSSVRLRVWDDRLNQETYFSMELDNSPGDSTQYDWWQITLPAREQPTILYYFFELNRREYEHCLSDQDFYVDDNPKHYGGGYGTMSENYDTDRGFQITVYDPSFSVPSWMQRGVVYQIYPDRFRDGNSGNNPTPGRFYYGVMGGTIFRSNREKWNTRVCDPRWIESPHCHHKYGENFYGGDLRGIIEKMKEGYFANLGVSVLYLNPIFKSPSSHKYDISNYFEIDPDFGTLDEFRELVDVAHEQNIKVILDGVFNHTSSDSIYFDLYSNFSNAGACENISSPYRDWYYLPDIGNPARGTGPPVICAGGLTYEAWYGYGSLPKLRQNSPEVRNHFWSNGLHSVAPYWIKMGADGWRLDVGGDIDPGLTRDPFNDYWEGFRAAIRNSDITKKTDVLIVSEEWGDASPWLLGNEWDSVMNYRLRSALLCWFFTGCYGAGCIHSGYAFEDNDSRHDTHSGPINFIPPSAFNARLLSIWEDYPPMAFKAMMNVAGSHDTNRLRFLLKKINFNNDATAVHRMKEWWIFLFTYPGAPTLYYGDEVGLSHDGVFASGKYEDDPYNRTPFPWNDTPGDYEADTRNLFPHVRKMASIRNSYRALQDGDVLHGLIVDDERQIYGFARTFRDQTALVILNRSRMGRTVIIKRTVEKPLHIPDGTVFLDALNEKNYTVRDGTVEIFVEKNWGAILVEKEKVDTPAEIRDLSFRVSQGTVILRWSPVVRDTAQEHELVTRYEVYKTKDTNMLPGQTNFIASIEPLPLGNPDGVISYSDNNISGGSYYYTIRAFNATGKFSETSAAIRFHNMGY